MQERERPAKPRDAQTVEAILKTMGVESYDPRVVNQLLELLYRYVSSVLTDSRMFSEHADKSSIDLDDIKLAIRSRCNFTFTQPPPRDVTMRLVAERNVVPLPPVDQKAGIALPPAEFQLTAPSYEVVIEPPNNPDRTPQSSPKRPRLASSPRKANSSPTKSPKNQTKAIGVLRSTQSPNQQSAGAQRKMNPSDVMSSAGARNSVDERVGPTQVEVIDVDNPGRKVDTPMVANATTDLQGSLPGDSDVKMMSPTSNAAHVQGGGSIAP